MSFLHHPALQVLHWTCMISMIGLCLDPTGVGATAVNYVGHIGDGLGNIFNAVASTQTGTAVATQTIAVHAGHTAAVGSMTPAPFVLTPGVEQMAAAPPPGSGLESTYTAQFNSMSVDVQDQIMTAAKRANVSLDVFMKDYWCVGGAAP